MVNVRFTLVCAAAAHGWWFAPNATEVMGEEPPTGWRSRFKAAFPAWGERWEKVETEATSFYAWAATGVEGMDITSFDTGLWLLVDTVVGLLGWCLFGSSWPNVRTGCRRVMQISLVLCVSLVAHYIWAVCYPVVSLFVGLGMALIWLCRKLLRVLGASVFWVQRITGASPKLRRQSSTDRALGGPLRHRSSGHSREQVMPAR